MLRLIPLASLLLAFVLVSCLPQPTPAPLPSLTPIGTARPAATPISVGAATQPPKSVESQGLPIKKYAAPPPMTIDASASYTAVINTNKGSITLELFAQDAPVTVNNFIFLAEAGFYDGIIFHRVIPGFMIQGGDPTGTGFNGPGYQFQDELESDRVFSAPGVLAMANAGANTNGSQFFITVAPTPNLTGRHTIFGEVTQGQDVADTISLVRTAAANRPVEDVVIRSIDITRNGG